MKTQERAITAEDREKHASKLAGAVVETVGMLPHDAYINLANYVVACERKAWREAIERCAKIVDNAIRQLHPREALREIGYKIDDLGRMK